MRILGLREVKGKVQSYTTSNRVELEPELPGTRVQSILHCLPETPSSAGHSRAEPRLGLSRTVSLDKLTDAPYMVILSAQLPLKACGQPG